MKRSTASKGGFTLLEIMLVVMIIALLAGSVMMMVGGELDEARKSTAKADVTSMKTALVMFNAKNGGYPTTEQGLQALVTAKLRDEVPKDPWGQTYNYEAPGKHNPDGYDLYSSGPDRKAGTSDDIGNWKAASGT
jgi:general secretion pathway protein G